MKRSLRVARLLVATTLTLATLDQIALAATASDSPDVIQVEAAEMRNAPAQHQQETAIAGSPLTLLVQPPDGSTLRLTYIPNDGWSFEDRDASLKPTKARVTSALASQQKEDATANRPLTVFIDGPTGYTYIWIRDQGWKFVGRITDRIN